ncbi:MAG: metal-dependent phosphohydrolase, partial [Leptolyngbyaceae cyanobacterium SM2_5_2]|nr:metal-dependent phosphohydrolase [Leptolyngbyaceae cyanobacterium SM2_5_2]
ELAKCPLVAEVQALRLMPRLRAVATIISHRGECWDGSGQPAGLVGDAIPLESRMLGLVSAFQSRVAQGRHRQAEPGDLTLLSEVLTTCQQEVGQRWDPKLFEILSLMVLGLQQGMGLPTLPTKMTLGSGLLNPDLADQDTVFQPPAELLSQL